jgi:protein-L-isoaspartate(D-aspartate) O-methyltransferase
MASAALFDDSATRHYAGLRRAMVESQLRVDRVTDEVVIRSMRRVPRELFVPADYAGRAYVDELVPLGQGRFVLQPVVLGRLLSAATPRAGDRALVVGCGLGYATAVLTDIGVTVTSIDSDSGFVAKAATNLATAGYGQMKVVCGPMQDGVPANAPYDLILVEGAMEAIPVGLASQLAIGGKLVGVVMENGVGRGILGRKGEQDFGFSAFMDAMVPVLPGFGRPKGFTF